MIESLRDIASLCNRHNARLVLFIPPAYVSYRQHIEAVRLEGIAEEVRNLQTIFKNIVFLDYFDDSRFTASDFHDADHLSARGAEKLSRMIDTEIRVLGTSAKH